MVRKSPDGSLGDELGALIGRAAVGAVAAAVALLALGVVAEILRRRDRARRLRVRAARPDAADRRPHRSRLAPGADRDVHRATPRRRGRQRARVARSGQHLDHEHHPSRGRTRPTRCPTGQRRPPPCRPVPWCLIPPVTVERLDPSPPTTPPATRPPTATTPSAVAPSPPTAPSRSYVVQPGDCLWSIAAGLLGPAAGSQAIDTGWRAIYANNRAAIGDNPNLIHIGLTLELPPLDAQP